MKGEESEIRTKSCYGLPLSLDEEQERLGLVCITDTMCQPYLVLTNMTHFRGIVNGYVRLRAQPVLRRSHRVGIQIRELRS